MNRYMKYRYANNKCQKPETQEPTSLSVPLFHMGCTGLEPCNLLDVNEALCQLS